MTTRPNAQRAPKHASKAKHIKHRTITPRTSAKRCNNQPTPSASESSEIRTIQITDGLPEEKKKLVTALMMEIPGHWKSYGSLRTDLGKKLQELQTVFAQAGKNGRFVHCLRKLKIPKATAYEQIKRYERISPLPLVLKKSAESEGIDLAAPRIQKRLAEQTLSLDTRLDYLREIPCQRRFISVEPLMESLADMNIKGYSWILVGGMSGPTWEKDKMNLKWAAEVYALTQKQPSSSYFFKQCSAYRAECGIDGLGRYLKKIKEGNIDLIRSIPDTPMKIMPLSIDKGQRFTDAQWEKYQAEQT